MSTASTVVSVGIDVSKGRLDVALLREDRSVTQRAFPNTADGIGKFIAALKGQRTAGTVPCVIESTGDYHLLPSLKLTQAGFLVNVINPLITKRYQRSSIRNAKTDAIDAERLADIGLGEKDLRKFSAEPRDIMVKKAISYLGTLEKAKQRLVLASRRLRETTELLGGSLDLAATDETVRSLKRQIAELREFIRKNVGDQEAVQELGRLRGVSETQAAVLLGLVGQASFSHRDQLVAYVGLDIMPRQSGLWQGRGKLSKRGNAYGRKVLYQMAWSLKTHNDTYREYYERLYRTDGKHYTTCLMAVARKFLRFFYAYYWKGSVVIPSAA